MFATSLASYLSGSILLVLSQLFGIYEETLAIVAPIESPCRSQSPLISVPPYLFIDASALCIPQEYQKLAALSTTIASDLRHHECSMLPRGSGLCEPTRLPHHMMPCLSAPRTHYTIFLLPLSRAYACLDSSLQPELVAREEGCSLTSRTS